MVTRAKSVRPSAIAGSWYPGARPALTRTVADYIRRVGQPVLQGELLGLISPHAGYVYSGQTAAHAYHQLRPGQFGTVVLIGPSHRAWLRDYAVNAEDAFETPLGQVFLDQDLIEELSARLPLQRLRGDQEHSLEIQLPFLQHQLGEFTLVPILMSTPEREGALRLAGVLADLIQSRADSANRILLVASSDMHHIEDYDQVVRRDRRVVDALATYDLETLAALFDDPQCSVCGRLPILVVLHASRELGANSVEILHHTNSGEVTGRRVPGQYTVGYLAAAVLRTGDAASSGSLA